MRRNYPHRYICSVLEEMRNLSKTKNYNMLDSLIEEAQILANRMEAALEYTHDIEELHKERASLNKKISKLEKKYKRAEKLVKEG